MWSDWLLRTWTGFEPCLDEIFGRHGDLKIGFIYVYWPGLHFRLINHELTTVAELSQEPTVKLYGGFAVSSESLEQI